jgi:hypothetical protein
LDAFFIKIISSAERKSETAEVDRLRVDY